MKLNELSHDQFKEMIIKSVEQHNFDSEEERLECIEFVTSTIVSVTNPDLFPEVVNLFAFRFPFLATNLESQVLEDADSGLESILT